MFESLLCGASPGGVPADHRVEERDGPGAHPATQYGGEVSGGELGELEAHVGRQLVSLAPVRVRRSAEDAADLVYLIYLGAAGEERPPGVELGHDAAHRPHVDGTGVVGGSEQNLRGAVPPRAHVVCKGKRNSYELYDVVCHLCRGERSGSPWPDRSPRS